MSEAEQSWKRVNDKLQQVLRQYQLLQKENERLHRNIQVLKEKEEAQLRKTGALEIKIAALQAATGQVDDFEKKELEKRISQYIREIDRCITMLSE